MTQLKIAFRNLYLHKIKTLIVGTIIVFGTTLAIVGNAFVDSIARGMQTSLTQSVTGEIQLYSAEAKEPLSIFGNMDGGMSDIGHVADFGRIRDALIHAVPNIAQIVPMGVNMAMVSPGNLLDVKLEELRRMFQNPAARPAAREELKLHVRGILKDTRSRIEADRISMDAYLKGDELYKDGAANLDRALAESFWTDFDSKAEERLEFLANRTAPLLFDEPLVYLMYLGTVPEKFATSFPQFEIVKGELIPNGKRGFLFNDFFYETQIKHRVARRLDQIKKKMEKDHLTLAGDSSLRDLISTNIAQAAEVYTQISPAQAALLEPKMRKIPGLKVVSESGPQALQSLIADFLNMTDENFNERCRFFYSEVAPHLVLYKIGVGDVFPITAFSKTGYASSVNMKVYGTYRFKSFESSPIAGSFNVMDLISFRELFGFITTDRVKANAELEAEMGVGDLGRDDVASLFSTKKSSPVVVAPKRAPPPVRGGEVFFPNRDLRRRIFETQYTSDELENGIFLSSAVVLKDPNKLPETLKAIRSVIEREKLGIQAVDWQSAAGLVGKLTTMVRGVLYFLIAVTFGMATFIIMNSMLMATLERTREIGTMRAIGAQRTFLLTLFFQETFILSVVFGILGVFLGSAIVALINIRGIPAVGDTTSFFFSGDRLFLSINPAHILVVFLCMTLVAIVSTQYPAYRAMKISPLEAMRK